MEILFRERKTIKKRVQNLKKDGFYSPYQKKNPNFYAIPYHVCH